MKKADIKADGTTLYAQGSVSEGLAGYCYPVVVDKVEVPDIKIWKPSGNWGHTTKATAVQALIRRCDNLGTPLPNARPEWITLSKILGTWEEHLDIKQARNKREQSLNESLSDLEAEIKSLLDPNGERSYNEVYFARQDGSRYGRNGVGQATISAHTMRKLLDAARKAGEK